MRTVILLAAAAILPTLQFEGPTPKRRSYIEDLGKNDIIYYATGGEGEVLGAPGEHRNRQHLHGNNNTNENASVSYEDPTSSGLHVGIGIDLGRLDET